MNKIQDFWGDHSRWIVTGGVVLALLTAIVVQAAQPEPKIVAESPAETEVTFDLDSNNVYAAEDGVIVIPAAENAPTAEKPAATSMIVDSPDQIWSAGEVLSGSGYTLPEAAQIADGSIGNLTIPKLSLSVSVFETDNEMEAMEDGLAHFKTTSAWEGNVGLCGHNVNFDLTDGYFKRLHTLTKGDTLSYKTALGTRSYTVTTVKEIAASDWSYLGRTEDNRLTLITCISGKPGSRLVVQAVES